MTGLICYKHATVFCFDAFVQGLFTGAQDVPFSLFAVLTTPTASLLLTGGSERVIFPESEAENLVALNPVLLTMAGPIAWKESGGGELVYSDSG